MTAPSGEALKCGNATFICRPEGNSLKTAWISAWYAEQALSSFSIPHKRAGSSIQQDVSIMLFTKDVDELMREV